MTLVDGAGAPIEGALSAELSAVEIDVRCATALARIALRTLVEICPEAQARIRAGLEQAISDAQLEAVDGAEAVVCLLSDVAEWLRAEADTVVYIDA